MKKSILFIFYASVFFQTQAQDTIKNLVFEGAGIRGVAYAGAIAELEEHDMMQHIEKVGGTSAGAIIALTLSLGYNAKEIEDIIYLTNFKKFNYHFAGGVTRTFKRFGWYKGKKFDAWLGEIIEDKTGNADITFEELKLKGYKDLYCVATLLDAQRLEIYDAASHPNMKIRDAVRASMSVPLYFEAMFIDDQGNTYKKLKDCDSAHIVFDGGLIGNFPIFIFDDVVDGKRIANPETLGLRIDDDKQIIYDIEEKGLAPIKIKNLKQYINGFYTLALETANRSQLTTEDWQRTASISSKGIEPKIRKLKVWEKDLLLESGKKGIENYVLKH